MTLRPRTLFPIALAGLDPWAFSPRTCSVGIHELFPPIRRPPDQVRGRGIFNGLGRALLVLATLLCLTVPALAVRPDEMLKDPALEARARDIGQELRCLVCRNQSIDDSDADLAHDLRVLVRQRLVAGDTDRQVIGYIVSRYGDFVLLKPPFKYDTYLLWLGPGFILLVGLWGLGRYMRRQAGMAGPPPLSADEERRLAQILEERAEPKGTP
jgi:cytochrome c-type biogenesis protein CcmH